MAKLKAPFFGTEAWGSLGPDITLRRSPSGTIAERTPIPTNPKTPAQIAQRENFQACAAQFKTLSAAGKEAYRLQDPTSNYNAAFVNFMKECLMAVYQPHLVIIPMNYQAVIQGTWALTTNTSQALNFTFFNSSMVNGDQLDFAVYLPAGTYTLRWLHRKSASYAIAQFLIDGIQIASFDLYNATTLNNQISTQTNIVVASGGMKNLSLKVNGKNPLSTAFLLSATYITLWRQP